MYFIRCYKSIVLFVLFFLILVTCSTTLQAKEKDLPFDEGERLIYDVYCNGFRIGSSVLTFYGQEKIDGKELYFISFITKLPGFKDIEEIYAHKRTFLPFRVKRLISKIDSFKTKILEQYNQDLFEVNIEKKDFFSNRNYTIKKNSTIYNPILLTYYYRLEPNFKSRIKVAFPTAEFDVIFKGTETLNTNLGKYKTYIFTSIPKRFTFWLSADRKRIPLRIEDQTILDHTFVINYVENIRQ